MGNRAIAKTLRAHWSPLVMLATALVCVPAQAAEPSGADWQTAERPTRGSAERGADADVEATSGRTRYTVRRGDTLGEIARDHDVSVDDLRHWNDIEGDFIRAGQTLIIRGGHRSSHSRSRSRSRGGSVRFTYIVERGDALSRIANRHGVTVDDLVRWNRGIDPDLIRVGQEIRIYLDDRPGRSASVGRPNRGRLSISQGLRNGAGYHVRNPSRSYGTNETVEVLSRTLVRVHQRFPDAPELAIGDLSYESGGRMRPHASHQSGRDADIAYFTLDRRDGDGFLVATPDNLDVQRTWYLLKSLIDTGSVRYIFVDYELQAVLYEYAQRRGASAEELSTWFQYPRGESAGGMIRHASGHDDHFHIRFSCPSSDRRCRD